MARSAPIFSIASHFAAPPAVASTVAPKLFASWIATVPMPDVPPCTRKASPAARRPWSKTLTQTVKKVSGRAAASMGDRLPGIGSTWGSGVAT